MAIAGKVAITPKGEWNANTAYTKLDLVFYENASYIAIQPSTGVTPTNTAYWMLVVQSAGGADLEAIINGTTQVGNALTLDGHEAEDFVDKGETLTTPLLEKALSITVDGWYNFKLNRNSTDLPHQYYAIGSATVIVRNGSGTHEGTEVILWGSNAGGSRKIVTNYHTSSGTWTGWNEYATTADLANYLPLTGGELTASAREILTISRASGSLASIVFKGNGSKTGELGFDGTDRPAFWGTDNIARLLLHTGNKPTGTYTGNGTVRTIRTGGIGGAVLIRQKGATNHIIVDASGYFGAINGKADFGSGISLDASCNITLASDSVFNTSGVTYEYHVL